MHQQIKKRAPFLFTSAKRFFKSCKIRYQFIGGGCTIVTKVHPTFKILLFSFDENRVVISPVPINGWSLSLTAATFDEVLKKIEKHHVLFNKP